MAWNEPGGNKPDRDPWTSGGRKSNGPPDLDDVFRNLNRKMGGLFGKSSNNTPSSGGVGAAPLIILIVILLGAWIAMGFYKVPEAEKGVVLRLGKQQEALVMPGLRWNAPLIDEVRLVDVNRVMSLVSEGQMLTQDQNMVDVSIEVQYRVSEPDKFLFSAVNPVNSLQQATDSAFRYVIGHTKMDDIMTKGREKVRDETQKNLELIINSYQLGIEIISLNFDRARAPEAVADAFADAIKAQEDQERYVNLAKAYERETTQRAGGQVNRINQDAIAYEQQVVLQAQGDIERYMRLLPEYERAPEVTRQRLYLETMESVLGGVNKVVVSESNNNMLFLPLDKLRGQSPAATNTSNEPAAPTPAPSYDYSAPAASGVSDNGLRDSSRTDRRQPRG